MRTPAGMSAGGLSVNTKRVRFVQDVTDIPSARWLVGGVNGAVPVGSGRVWVVEASSVGVMDRVVVFVFVVKGGSLGGGEQEVQLGRRKGRGQRSWTTAALMMQCLQVDDSDLRPRRQ